MVNKPIRVAELFAGVGGFRLGLEGHPDSEEETGFKVVFSNQWEPPGTGRQWASEVYEARFGKDGHTNEDIHDIAFNEGAIAETIRKRIVPHDLLVGGFPCQDYSVARTISGELGIKGEKGKLWVPIRNIIREMRPRPKVILLENVQRLLNSPAKQRGLNFALILQDLIKLGYDVEWKVINAADYGMPQQRSRVFLIAYRIPGSSSKTTNINGPEKFAITFPKTKKRMEKWLFGNEKNWKVEQNSPFTKHFPSQGKLPDKPQTLSEDLKDYTHKSSAFGNIGYAWRYRYGGKNPKKQEIRFWTTKAEPIYFGNRSKLEDILDKNFIEKYEVDPSRLDEWLYAKGNKNEFRIRKPDRENIDPELLALYDRCMDADYSEKNDMWTRYRSRFLDEVGPDKFYKYDEGTMGLDQKSKPSRTVVTAEIGTSPSRMRHIFEESPGRFRRLSPTETERLNMFPTDWTLIDGIKDSRRGFLMGNALVVGIIERLREPLSDLITRRSKKEEV
jgi:DNA (cytosine-5)-methyltransferase 1